MWRKTVGVVKVLAIGVMLLFATSALAERLYWIGTSTTANGTTAFTAADMATMTYYIRLDKPVVGTVGQGGFYYLAETRNGVQQWPADNALATFLRGLGLGGQAVRFTVSMAFVDNGVEQDSAQSAPYPWTVPLEQVAALTIVPAAGNYTTPQAVTLSTTTAGASIRYTLDNTTPSSTVGAIYTVPIQVGVTTTIRAVAYKAGMADTVIAAATYTFPFRPRTPAAPTGPAIR
jgi:hypothetical protein